MKRFLFAAALLASIPAAAADFSTPLMDIDGCAFIDVLASKHVEPYDYGPGCNKQDQPPLTLGRAAYHALLGTYPDDKEGSTNEEKWRRGTLAERVWDAKDLSLKAEEVAIVKNFIGRLYNGAIVRQCWVLLDPSLK